MEARTLRIPSSNALRADLRSIKKEVTSAGHLRFAAERSKGGHADRFWALALALHAAQSPQTTTAYECISRSPNRRFSI
jgi:phage FluMu gp28-like protein